jgi:hypothetical protein
MALSSMPKMRIPTRVLKAPPSPPAKELPPTTTPEITTRGILSPWREEPVFKRQERRIPLTAAVKAVIIKTEHFTKNLMEDSDTHVYEKQLF